MKRLKTLFELVKATLTQWNEDKIPQLAAALAFYTMFSLAPLLIIVISIVGVVFGTSTARHEIVAQVQSLVGQSGAELLDGVIENASQQSSGVVATIVGIVTLFLGASGVFGQIKATLQMIWDVKPRPAPTGLINIVVYWLRSQFLPVSMVLVFGFLLLISLVVSAVFSALSAYVSQRFGDVAIFGQLLNFVVSFGFTTLLFAGMYKYVSGRQLAWRHVFPGALITALLFNIGRILISAYLGRSSFSSTYGAAGSLVVILLWVYYSAQILFFGAEFTRVYTQTYYADDPKPVNPDTLPTEPKKVATPKKADALPNPVPTPPRRDPLLRVGRLLQLLLPAALLMLRIWQITERFQVRRVVGFVRGLVGKRNVAT
ncbi:MAG: YihY/virulence factor BrkB family protein [Anaerolineae bacterium]|nr:YihY/virulence factor BrkB family protein [Anaerolineae bacterium]